MDTALTTQNQEDAIKAFLNNEEAAQHTSGSHFIQPLKISFNGQSGKYFKKYWDNEKKAMVTEEFSQSWTGTILNPIMHFYNWKYDPSNTRFRTRTREFSDWKDQIELIKIDYQATDKDKRTETLGIFNGLEDLKAKCGQKDFATGKVKYPWDLVESVYIYVHELNQVVNYQFDSSTTRDAFWDYRKPGGFRSIEGTLDENIRAFAQVKTEFGVSDVITHPTLKNDDGTPKKYYSGTFKSSSLNTTEELRKIMEMSNDLKAWMNSFKPVKANLAPQETFTDGTPVPLAPPKQEIRLEDIPF